MNKCIIVGSCKESWKEFTYDDSDFIIASDGGLEFLLSHHYRVNLALGDFDSLGYIPTSLSVIKLNPIKDISDSHACLEEGFKRGYRNFEIYGCIGGRIDHSFAILQDAYHFKKKGANVKIYSKNQCIFFLINEKIELNKEEGYISVFCYGEKASEVTMTGLKYEVNNICLKNDFPLGLSNEFTNKKATIAVNDGCLLVVM